MRRLPTFSGDGEVRDPGAGQALDNAHPMGGRVIASSVNARMAVFGAWCVATEGSALVRRQGERLPGKAGQAAQSRFETPTRASDAMLDG